MKHADNADYWKGFTTSIYLYPSKDYRALGQIKFQASELFMFVS